MDVVCFNSVGELDLYSVSVGFAVGLFYGSVVFTVIWVWWLLFVCWLLLFVAWVVVALFLVYVIVVTLFAAGCFWLVCVGVGWFYCLNLSVLVAVDGYWFIVLR